MASCNDYIAKKQKYQTIETFENARVSLRFPYIYIFQLTPENIEIIDKNIHFDEYYIRCERKILDNGHKLNSIESNKLPKWKMIHFQTNQCWLQ